MNEVDAFALGALDPAEDAQALLALWQASRRQEAALLGVDEQRFAALRVGLRDLMASSETWLGAWRQRELVGALAWGADEHDPRVQQISALLVAPAQQRQGVATRLLHALMVLSAGSPLSVHLPAGNAPALALFDAQGFRVVHRWLGDDGLRWLRLRRVD